jgi:hypothetical protein
MCRDAVDRPTLTREFSAGVMGFAAVAGFRLALNED